MLFYCSIKRPLCSLHGSLENMVLWSCWEGANTDFLMLLPSIQLFFTTEYTTTALTVIHFLFFYKKNYGKDEMSLCWMYILYAPTRMAVLKRLYAWVFVLEDILKRYTNFFSFSAKVILTHDLGYVLYVFRVYTDHKWQSLMHPLLEKFLAHSWRVQDLDSESKKFSLGNIRHQVTSLPQLTFPWETFWPSSHFNLWGPGFWEGVVSWITICSQEIHGEFVIF